MDVLPEVLFGVISFVSPYIASFFTRTTMSSRVKNGIAFGIALVIAVIYVIATGGISDFSDLNQIAGALAVAFTIQQLAYRQILINTATKVEANYGVGSKSSYTKANEVETVAVEDGSEAVVVEDQLTSVDTQAKG